MKNLRFKIKDSWECVFPFSLSGHFATHNLIWINLFAPDNLIWISFLSPHGPEDNSFFTLWKDAPVLASSSASTSLWIKCSFKAHPCKRSQITYFERDRIFFLSEGKNITNRSGQTTGSQSYFQFKILMWSLEIYPCTRRHQNAFKSTQIRKIPGKQEINF